MENSSTESKKVLVTGGTSGLGLELVKLFLRKGYYVVVTGRKSLTLPGFENGFKLYKIDFSDLQLTAETIKQICDCHRFDIVINNAGILSPHNFCTTKDGLEYTFQVNFISHLLINEIIIRKQADIKPLRIAAVSSPVHRIAKCETTWLCDGLTYNPIMAYSNSKLYLSLMCSHLATIYHYINLQCFSFVPGVFGSDIYRMQGKTFRFLYRIAAPFMRRSSKVAKVLFEILTNKELTNGAVYNIRRREKPVRELNSTLKDEFWKVNYDLIAPFLTR